MTTLGYLEDLEHGCSCTDYVTIKDLQHIPGDDFSRCVESIINDRSTKIKWFLAPVAWRVMTKEQQNIWMDLSEVARVIRNRSFIPIFQQKDSNSGQYGRISYKESNNPIMRIQAIHTT